MGGVSVCVCMSVLRTHSCCWPRVRVSRYLFKVPWRLCACVRVCVHELPRTEN